MNQTVGALIYAAGTAAFGYTAKTGGLLTLTASMSGMSSTDELMIIYDDNSVLGTNVLGYSGSLNFGPTPATLTLSAGSYPIGASIGGLKTLSVLRSTVQASATLAQIMFQWPSGSATTPVVVLLFSKLPTSTFTDGVAINGGSGLSFSDAAYLIAPPQAITPVTYTGILAIPTGYAAGSWPLKNSDTTISTNIYVAVLAGAAITSNIPASAQVSISGVQD